MLFGHPVHVLCIHIFPASGLLHHHVPDELCFKSIRNILTPPSSPLFTGALTCFPAAWVFICLSFCVCNNCDCDKLSFCAKFACFIFTGSFVPRPALFPLPCPPPGSPFLKHNLRNLSQYL